MALQCGPWRMLRWSIALHSSYAVAADACRQRALQAAVSSAVSFTLGAGIPLLAAAFIHDHTIRLYSIFASSTVALLVFGAIGAALGGASLTRGALRVAIGGCGALTRRPARSLQKSVHLSRSR